MGDGGRGRSARTLQALVHAPVDAQAVLLLLHTALAAAVVERLLLEGLHGAAALVLGLQAGCQAEVSLLARHALPQRAVLGAAALLLQALIAGFHAIQAVPPAHLGRQEHVCGWRRGSVSNVGQRPLPLPGGERVLDLASEARRAASWPAPLRPGVHFPARGPPAASVSPTPQPPGPRGLRGRSRFAPESALPTARTGPAAWGSRAQKAAWPPGLPSRRPQLQPLAPPGPAEARGLSEEDSRRGAGALSAAGPAGSAETLFGEKFSLRSLLSQPSARPHPTCPPRLRELPGTGKGRRARGWRARTP